MQTNNGIEIYVFSLVDIENFIKILWIVQKL